MRLAFFDGLSYGLDLLELLDEGVLDAEDAVEPREDDALLEVEAAVDEDAALLPLTYA